MVTPANTTCRTHSTRIVYLLFLLLVAMFTGCSRQEKSGASVAVQHGKLIKAEKIGTYDTVKLNRILNEELKEFLSGATMRYDEFNGKYQTPANSLTLYKITYQSFVPELNNKAVEQTGLVAIPSNFAPGTPMVSYQHGTVFSKTGVPSNIEESMETKLVLAQFGGQGYVVIAADYGGLGDSKLNNTYMSRRSNEQSCMDMYAAAQEFLAGQKIQVGHFFTLGWSQGAYNTLIFLRRLEQAKIPVTASMTAATPADLFYLIAHGILNPRPLDAKWGGASFAILLFSYENYGGLAGLTKGAINPKYYQAAKDFYEFKINFTEFFQQTTPDLMEFLTPAFVEEIRLGSSPLSQALNAAEGYRWRSQTPLRSYYGEKDEAIPLELAKLAIEFQSSMGKKNGELVLAGANADHRSTYVVSLYDSKPWFDSFLKK